jgi:hypothetical protein
MTHPLTDEIISKQFGRYDGIDDAMVYDEDDMRTAADWQLEHIIEWFKESTSHFGAGDCLYFDNLHDLDEGIENVIRKAMRPTQKDS